MNVFRTFLPLLGLGALVLMSTDAAQAQEAGSEEGEASATAAFVVDEARAARGKNVFRQKGCNACHTIGKGRSAGPDLLGVTDRREIDWLQRFLKDPPAMLDSDSIAKALLKEFRNARMPNMRLSDTDVEALIHYFAQETAAR